MGRITWDLNPIFETVHHDLQAFPVILAFAVANILKQYLGINKHMKVYSLQEAKT